MLQGLVAERFRNNEFEAVLIVARVQSVSLFVMQGVMGEERSADRKETIGLTRLVRLDNLACHCQVLRKGCRAGTLVIHCMSHCADVIEDVGSDGILAGPHL